MLQRATAACLLCAQSGRTGPGRVRSIGVGAGEKAVRAPGSADASGPECGAAASARAALYPGKEAPQRRPVTPGPAGPSELPPRHSLARARRPTIATDLPADRHRRPEQASERPLPPRAGQQQASARPGPTRLNGPLQTPGPGARRAIGGSTRRSVPSSTPTGCGACPSSSRPCEPAFLPGAHWSRPLAGSAPGAVGVGERGQLSVRWAARGGRRPRRSLGARPAPARRGGRQGRRAAAPSRASRAFQLWQVLQSLTLCPEYRPPSPASPAGVRRPSGHVHRGRSGRVRRLQRSGGARNPGLAVPVSGRWRRSAARGHGSGLVGPGRDRTGDGAAGGRRGCGLRRWLGCGAPGRARRGEAAGRGAGRRGAAAEAAAERGPRATRALPAGAAWRGARGGQFGVALGVRLLHRPRPQPA